MRSALLCFALMAISLFAKETTPAFTQQTIGKNGWNVNAKQLLGNNKGTILVEYTLNKMPTTQNKMLPIMHLRTASRLRIGYTYYAGGSLQFSFSDREHTFNHNFPAMKPGESYKLGVTWNGTTVCLYKNGRMVASGVQPMAIDMEIRNLNLGPYKDDWYNMTPWEDEITVTALRTFDEALTAEKIAEIYSVKMEPLTATHPMLITIPPIPAGKTAPEINGKLNDECWKFAGSMPHLIRGNFPKKSGSMPPHSFKMTYDKDNLYVGFTTIFPGRVPLQEGAIRTSDKEPEPWGTESAELYLYVNDQYYRFAVSLAGGTTEWKNNDSTYNVPWQYQGSRQMNIDDSILWQGEMSIPWSSIELKGVPSQASVNFCRTWKLPDFGTHSSMNITGDVYSGPEGNLIPVKFDSAAVFQMKEQGNPSTGEYMQKFSIATPKTAKVTYELALAKLDGSASPMPIYTRSWSLGAGEVMTDGVTSAISATGYDALLYTFSQNGKVTMREILPFELNDDFFTVTPLFLHEKISIRLKQNMLKQKFGASFAGSIQLTTPDGKKTIYKADKDSIELPFKRSNAAGKYRVALVNSANGKVIDSKELNYPGIGEWEHQDFHTERIIPPFTPLQYSQKGKSFTASLCNGRSYTWNNSMFPTKISANNKSILQKPIEFLVNGAAISTADFKVAASKPHHADITSAASGNGVSISAKSWLEYDGVQMNYLTVKSTQQLDSLSMRITLPASLAKYVHGAGTGGWGSKVTEAIANGNTTYRYFPSFWIGNEEAGFCFFTETINGWNINEQKMFEISKDNENAVLTIHFMNKMAANTTLQLELGFIATPVRPLDQKYPFNTFSWSYIAPLNRPGKRPTSDIVYQCSAPSGDLGSFFGDIDDTEGHKTEDSLKKDLEYCKGHNVRPIPYTCARYLSIKYPETAAYLSEWTFKPMIEMDYTHTGHFVYDCCPTTSASDFFVWRYKQMLKHFPQIKGLYFDFGSASECSNELHGCKARVPMLAQREFYRRIAIAQLEAGIQEPVIVIHNTDRVQLPSYTFGTHLLNGEQVRQASSPLLHNKKDILDSYDISIFASELSTLPWGITNSVYMPIDNLLPQYGGDEEDAPYKFRMDKAIFAATLIHNTIPCIWRNHFGMFDKLIRTYDNFGVEQAEFIGYWKAPAKVTGASDIYVSCFVSKEKKKLLAVIGHVGKPHVNQDFSITFDTAKLGLKGKLSTAVDTMPAADPDYDLLFQRMKQYNVPVVRGPIQIDTTKFGSKVLGFDGKTLKMHLDFHSFAIVEIK